MLGCPKLEFRAPVGAPCICIISSSYVNSNWNYSPETAKLGCDLCDLDVWPWPFAWTLPWSLVMTPENFMMIRWWEHSQKGVMDRRTDRRTKNTIHRAVWSQLKMEQEGPDGCVSLPLGNLLVMTSDWQYGFRDVRSLDTKIFNQSEPTESQLAFRLWKKARSLRGIYTMLQWRLGFCPFILHWRCKAKLSHWRIQRDLIHSLDNSYWTLTAY